MSRYEDSTSPNVKDGAAFGSHCRPSHPYGTGRRSTRSLPSTSKPDRTDPSPQGPSNRRWRTPRRSGCGSRSIRDIRSDPGRSSAGPDSARTARPAVGTTRTDSACAGRTAARPAKTSSGISTPRPPRIDAHRSRPQRPLAKFLERGRLAPLLRNRLIDHEAAASQLGSGKRLDGKSGP
jgi:hypothetical protein